PRSIQAPVRGRREDGRVFPVSLFVAKWRQAAPTWSLCLVRPFPALRDAARHMPPAATGPAEGLVWWLKTLVPPHSSYRPDGGTALFGCFRWSSTSQVVRQIRHQGGLRLGADDLLRRLALVEQHHRRNRHHLVVPSELGVLVDVQLGDGDLVMVLGGDLLEHRCDH